MKEINKVKFAKLSVMPKDCYDKLTDEQKQEVIEYVKQVLAESLMKDYGIEAVLSSIQVEEVDDMAFSETGEFMWVHKYGCSLWVDNIDPTAIVKLEQEN